MSLGENFHPELGYVVPTRNFMSYFRVAVVATAIGAASGAAVVAALADRPGWREDTSTAARSLVTDAPVMIAASENAPIDDAALATALREQAMQRESLAAHVPAPQAIAVSTAHELPSTHPASAAPAPLIAAATDNAARRVDSLSGTEAAITWRNTAAKVVMAKRTSAKPYHSQTAANGGNYRNYNYSIAPPYQLMDRRPFVQLGFGESRYEWR